MNRPRHTSLSHVSKRTSVLALTALGLVAVAQVAQAHDFARNTFPREWIEPHVPEDLPALEHPSYFNALDTARAEVMRGRYKLALATLYEAGDAVDPQQAALIRAEALFHLGRTDAALEALAPEPVAQMPEAQVLRSRVLADDGRTDEALEALRAHVAEFPDSIPGHFWLGRVSERIGDLEAARQAYAWFVEDQHYLDKWSAQQSNPAFESAEAVTLIGRAIDRHAQLTGAYQHDVRLHDLILNMFVRAYDVIDRTYWPARVAAAEYFIWHDQDKEAGEELQAALTQNPNDAEALRLLGLLSLSRWDFDRAEQVIAALRDVNPNSTDASLIEARNLLRQRLPKEAEVPLRRVLDGQPKNIEALGLLAATYALQLRDDEAGEVLEQVDSIDAGHDDATAYFEVAEQLGGMRQYPRAAAMYQVAIDRAPWWTAPRNGLGLLYTQSGEEDLARATLNAARALDPFNLATTNYLRLLDDLAAFAQVETDHFIIYHDATLDPLIAGQFADYLESIYDDVTGAFDHEPAVKTMIEVFPTHEGFSVRTTGSPWIGTVGASTGRVIAMVAPRKGRNTMGPYNWAQVLRHEFTHTVTLSATDNRIAHWMTEGLAVLQENSPLKWEWVPMLYRAVTHDELFTLDNLTWGFVRPRRPTDRALAYAQSYWICKYIQDTHGNDALLAMLDGFRDGRTQDQVFQHVLDQSPSEFTEDFFAWADEQVAGWGYDEETTEKYDELRERGEMLIQGRQYEEAIPVWQEIAELRPVDPLPHQRLAGLYIRLDQPEQAAEQLAALHAVETKDNRYAKRAARLYRDADRLDDAVRFARESVYIDPYDHDAHTLLAELYAASGQAEDAAKERELIATLEQWQQEQRAR